MSFWVTLEDENGETVQVAEQARGGTYAVYLEERTSFPAELNVTYNYSIIFSVRALHNMIAGNTIGLLQEVFDKNGVKRADDYWAPTPGNVGYMASILLAWAKQYPDAKWRVN